MTLLSDVAIKRHMDYGSIVIDPFRPERLNTDSYDLELGPFFWRFDRKLSRRPAEMDRGQGFRIEDGGPAGGIWLGVGERVLGHSVEIAGGRVGERPNAMYNPSLSKLSEMSGSGPMDKTVPTAVTTHLQATSTAARHGISACMCAGWGDVGFVNVWVLEITNHSPDRIWLPVGSLIAQVAFSQVEVPDSDYAARGGQYQPKAVDVESIRSAWSPESMLPGSLKVREGWKDVSWPTEDSTSSTTIKDA